eukprot:CAMPEP_0174885376 /NCGR_PEP_ID=MMETSP0167-20121228/645_1 /TAXON_ID=38298 /ORGANISM="Rhodella maculata, Strain CCMP736" /LENGTH=117 /DNA_ID=CAMNT_0016120921 /DNA_START=138 /DNA_END=488 /DNA_ORIENTATION=+
MERTEPPRGLIRVLRRRLPQLHDIAPKHEPRVRENQAHRRARRRPQRIPRDATRGAVGNDVCEEERDHEVAAVGPPDLKVGDDEVGLAGVEVGEKGADVAEGGEGERAGGDAGAGGG